MLTIGEFIRKWQKSRLTERSASQSHFIDLCLILDQPSPTHEDVTGEEYTFEKGAKKISGSPGFADVWKRGYFAWEYKGKLKDLAAAYDQILNYREALENPPLLVVCDLNRFEVHTNFTRTPTRVFAFTLSDLASPDPTPTCALPPLAVLRAVFEDPDRLRPDQTKAYVTKQAAEKFSELAHSLQRRGHDPLIASRFLIRVLFCLFSEDIGLLPEKLFSQILYKTRTRPVDFGKRLSLLFESMATGGSFGADDIKHFNGGLFTDSDVLPLNRDELEMLDKATKLDWSAIEPSIFGTLFERSLDPKSRAQLGAHYTSSLDIKLIVEPVVMAPLRRRWDAVKSEAIKLLEQPTSHSGNRKNGKPIEAASKLLRTFADEIAAIRVLDPACGSGNFLYVALRELLNLQKEVITFAIEQDIGGFFPTVGPEQMLGIEINEYAHELAPITVWIGYIQWMAENGYGFPGEPILRAMDAIAGCDAILAVGGDGELTKPEWPTADCIIGNPPFLGGKILRTELGDSYVDKLFTLYDGDVPREADLVTYWFERSRQMIAEGRVKRVGLLATNSIRGGANHKVLERIKQTGDIFMAWADRPWILNGASVRVSMVGFDDGTQTERRLDGLDAIVINSDLTGATNLMSARHLVENINVAFMGDTKGGAFDLPEKTGREMLSAPLNPNGRPNSDVVRPRINVKDVTGRLRNTFIIDFGTKTSEDEAAFYEQPFEHVVEQVKPTRLENNRQTYRDRWWIHAEPRPNMRNAIMDLKRFIVTPALSKHRLFTWVEHPTLPDHALFVFARDDDYFFGILHSRVHELWSLRRGTTLEDRPRYTTSTCFDTFPFPWPPGLEPKDSPLVEKIAAAARTLVEKRDAWLNPLGATEAQLSKRTLTELYNQRPAWLAKLHDALDVAVLAAYGWPADVADNELLELILALNHQRAGLGTVPGLPHADAQDDEGESAAYNFADDDD